MLSQLKLILYWFNYKNVPQCTALNNLGKDVALMELRRRGSLTSGELQDIRGLHFTLFLSARLSVPLLRAGSGSHSAPHSYSILA